MLIPLIFPIDCPLWIVALSVIFAVVIGKEVFGGTGMNILNPALLARGFAFFAYPTKLSGDKVWVSDGYTDAISGETALGELATLVKDNVSTEQVNNVLSNFSSWYLQFMNSFSRFYSRFYWRNICTGCFNWSFYFTCNRSWFLENNVFPLLGGFFMASIFIFVGANPFMELNPIHQLCIGGFMFAIVFMATDPVSAAQTNTGKLIYGFCVGF